MSSPNTTLSADADLALAEARSLRRSGQLTEAAAALERAISLYTQVGDQHGRAQALQSLGYTLRDLSSYEESMRSFEQARTLFADLHDELNAARCLVAIGGVHGACGRLTQAFEAFHSVLDVALRHGDAECEAVCVSDIANVYLGMGEHASAVEQFHRALAIYEDLGDNEGIARVLGNLAISYRFIGEYDRALEHLHRALALQQERGGHLAMARIKGRIGNVLVEKGDLQGAVNLLHEAVTEARTLGASLEEASYITSLARAVYELGDTTGSRTLLEDHRDLLESHTLPRYHYRMLLGKLLAEANELSKARTVLQACAAEAEANNALEELAGAHRELREVAERANDLPAYVAHNTAYMNLREQHRGEQQQRRLDLLEADRRISEERRLLERQRSLLTNMLPESIAERMIAGDTNLVDHYTTASVLFIDMVNFTGWTTDMDPKELLTMLNAYFDLVDRIINHHNLTKVKTIGDAYLAVANAPSPLSHHQAATARAALDIMEAFAPYRDRGLDLRIGLHCGSLLAGVVGTTRTVWDVWGDTVNVASRMETHSSPGRINVSADVRNALVPSDEFDFEQRGTVDVKGKGAMEMYFLQRNRLSRTIPGVSDSGSSPGVVRE